MPSFAEKCDDYLIRYLAYFNYNNYVERISLHGNERVLEVGCGGGNLSRFLAGRLPQGKLICIDNSDYWLQKAKDRLKKFGNISFELENILDLNEEYPFDVVIVHYVLHDIQKEGREKAINILRTNLKDNGLIYIREPARNSHGIPFEEIRSLMIKKDFLEEKSKEGYSFPLRGKIYEGVFRKKCQTNKRTIKLARQTPVN